MKTAMQELKDIVQLMIENGGTEDDLFAVIAHIDNTFIEKEKKQMIAPVDRLCDFYGHPHVGEQMYNTRYTKPKLKPIHK